MNKKHIATFLLCCTIIATDVKAQRLSDISNDWIANMIEKFTFERELFYDWNIDAVPFQQVRADIRSGNKVNINDYPTVWNRLNAPNAEHQTYIFGHWNYEDESEYAQSLTFNGREDFCKPVHIASNSDSVVLFLNSKRLDTTAIRESEHLFTFPLVQWEPGRLEAIGYDHDGNIESRYAIETSWKPQRLTVRAITKNNQIDPSATPSITADGSDLAILEFEVVDKKGRRCPLDNRLVKFTIKGPAEWLGSVDSEQNIHQSPKKELPLINGINRAIIRSLTKSGTIKITATAEALPPTDLILKTRK